MIANRPCNVSRGVPRRSQITDLRPSDIQAALHSSGHAFVAVFGEKVGRVRLAERVAEKFEILGIH